MGEAADALTVFRQLNTRENINSEKVLISLKSILIHPLFSNSRQISSFLRYVVEEELSGRGEKIKAYSIALDALGRSEDFDSSSDPVIRVVANRLRKALKKYYESGDAQIPVQILLVKGSYRPVFVPRAPSLPVETDEALIAVSGQAHPPQANEMHCRLIISVLLILLMLSLAYIGFLINASPNPHLHAETIAGPDRMVNQIPD